MENVFTWKWLRAALVRALKTVAQTAAATIGTAVMISEVDWRMVVSAALLAGASGALAAGSAAVKKRASSLLRMGTLPYFWFFAPASASIRSDI